MSNYRRLISYIYAYEGGVKGKNIGYAKIEIRGDQCRIQVSVKKVYVGSSEIGVYLLSPGAEILLGRIFIRNGAGEFRIQVKPDNVEGSGCSMDRCYGLTIHDVDSAWQCYTTIWEDAVAQAAEIELADVTAENLRKKAAQEARPEMKVQELSAEEEKSSAKAVAEEPEQEVPASGMPAEDKSMEDLHPEEVEKAAEELAQEKLAYRLPVSEEIERELEWEQERLEAIAPWEEPDTATYSDPGIEADPGAGREQSEAPDMSAEMVMYIAGEPMLEPEWMPEPQQEVRQVPEPQQAPDSMSHTGEQLTPVKEQPAARAESFVQNAVNKVMRQIIQPIRQQEQPTRQVPPMQEQQPFQVQPAQVQQPQPAQPPQAQQPQPTQQPQAQQQSQVAQQQPQPPHPQPTPAPPTIPEPENLARLEELDRLERENSARNNLWDRLQRQYTKVLAFDYDNGCEILSIKPQDIGLLPREIWVFGNNSFLLHGYYNYRHLILARLNNPQGAPRYLLGVPGHYFSNEKYMASMFGFPHFVLARKQPEEDGRFGYWYTDIRL